MWCWKCHFMSQLFTKILLKQHSVSNFSHMDFVSQVADHTYMIVYIYYILLIVYCSVLALATLLTHCLGYYYRIDICIWLWAWVLFTLIVHLLTYSMRRCPIELYFSYVVNYPMIFIFLHLLFYTLANFLTDTIRRASRNFTSIMNYSMIILFPHLHL